MSLEKTQIARQFSRAAETYDDVAALQCAMADRLIEQVLACQKRGQTPFLTTRDQTLVDFGCGTGTALAKIAAKTKLKLIGLDLAEGMIERARERLQPFSQINLIVSDLEQTGLEDHSIDIVFSNAAIQWCDSGLAFSEFARVLRPGGRLLVSTFGPQTLEDWKQAWQSIGDNSPRVHRFESAEQLTANLASTGFSSIELVTEMRSLEFKSVREMFGCIKQLGATNASENRARGMLGKDTYQRLRRLFEDRLAQDGILRLKFECFYLSAVFGRTERTD